MKILMMASLFLATLTANASGPGAQFNWKRVQNSGGLAKCFQVNARNQIVNHLAVDADICRELVPTHFAKTAMSLDDIGSACREVTPEGYPVSLQAVDESGCGASENSLGFITN